MTLKKKWQTSLVALMLTFGTAAAVSVLPAASALASTTEVAGVKVEDVVDVAGSKLVLNGAGIRYKAVFKVYVAAFYVGKKVSTPEEFYAAAGPKRISLTMLREVESNEMGKNFTKGFADNVPKADMSKLIQGLVRMGQVFADQKKLVAGDTIVTDWIPGTGTVITVKGKVQGEPFKEPGFYNAMLSIWLGPNPADWKLKDALLDKPS
ncbi:MAG: chalcone isomerase family protein [Chitinophagaceae bacterium]|nr:chalcone isomerase family protein [Polaromonas sp.]